MLRYKNATKGEFIWGKRDIVALSGRLSGSSKIAFGQGALSLRTGNALALWVYLVIENGLFYLTGNCK
jgi:hypothetical protein